MPFVVGEGVPAEENWVVEKGWIWTECGEVRESELGKVKSEAHGNYHRCIDFVMETVGKSLGFHP